jgi:predicted nuclease with TOPRIM domain
MLTMNPADIAKDAIRIASTAGLSKDVIDLLKEKVALLTEKIAALEQEKTVLNGENSNLRQEIEKLKQELDRLRPKQGGLDDTAKKFVKILFEAGGYVDFEQAAAHIGVTKGKAAYYRDVLLKEGILSGAGIVIGDVIGEYELSPKGREFAVSSGLV